MPSSVSEGVRPSVETMRLYSSAVTPCCARSAGVISAGDGVLVATEGVSLCMASTLLLHVAACGYLEEDGARFILRYSPVGGVRGGRDSGRLERAGAAVCLYFQSGKDVRAAELPSGNPHTCSGSGSAW